MAALAAEKQGWLGLRVGSVNRGNARPDLRPNDHLAADIPQEIQRPLVLRDIKRASGYS